MKATFSVKSLSNTLCQITCQVIEIPRANDVNERSLRKVFNLEELLNWCAEKQKTMQFIVRHDIHLHTEMSSIKDRTFVKAMFHARVSDHKMDFHFVAKVPCLYKQLYEL